MPRWPGRGPPPTAEGGPGGPVGGPGGGGAGGALGGARARPEGEGGLGAGRLVEEPRRPPRGLV